MNKTDPFVDALSALCKRERGVEVVAEKARVSPANLQQIMAGTPLPSGNMRSVGSRLRAKLTEAYPDWLSIGDVKEQTEVVPDPFAKMRKLYAAIPEENKTSAIYAATEAMINFLTTYTNQEQPQGAQEAMPSEESPSLPAAHKTL